MLTNAHTILFMKINKCVLLLLFNSIQKYFHLLLSQKKRRMLIILSYSCFKIPSNGRGSSSPTIPVPDLSCPKKNFLNVWISSGWWLFWLSWWSPTKNVTSSLELIQSCEDNFRFYSFCVDHKSDACYTFLGYSTLSVDLDSCHYQITVVV